MDNFLYFYIQTFLYKDVHMLRPSLETSCHSGSNKASQNMYFLTGGDWGWGERENYIHIVLINHLIWNSNTFTGLIIMNHENETTHEMRILTTNMYT